jgi:SSS family solute:Na+ symporter
VFALGDGAYLAAHVPAAHLRLPGALPRQELCVWAIIALSTLVDPTFYQRCYAAESPAVARRGVLLAIAIWGLFDVCTVFSGIYARAALPGIDPTLAFPLLAVRLLPPGLRGLYFCGMLATVMSTIDSYLFVGAMTLSHDLFRRRTHRQDDDQRTLATTRWAIGATAALGTGLALAFNQSIKAIWKTIGSLSSASLLAPMLLGFAGLRPPHAGAAALAGGIVGTVGWASLRGAGLTWALRVEALFAGLALSVAAFLCAWAVALRSRR